MVAKRSRRGSVTLIAEIRADLEGLPTDVLLPPPRRGQSLRCVALTDAAPLGVHSAVVGARLSDGREIWVPLVRDEAWRRAEPGDAMSLDALMAPAPLVVHPGSARPDFSAYQERSLDVDMSNDIRIIDDSIVAKWQFVAEPGSLAGPRMLEHLAEAGFEEAPELLATVSWRGCLIVSYTKYLPDAEDGWGWMLKDVLGMINGRVPAPEWPAHLGALTGRLHAAAARATSVIPQSLGHTDLAPLARHYRALLAAELDSNMRDALAQWTDRFERACTVLESASNVEVIPLHGDLHPGQFLRWRNGLAVSDFDGNPLVPAEERGYRGPTAHDVAGLLRGLDHVAIAASRRAEDPDALMLGRSWARQAREQALSAYLKVDGVPTLDESILSALESLSPLHEAVYASTYLPQWRYVPLAVLGGVW